MAKSCPDRSELNGCLSGTAPGARTAVPMALNSRPPAGNEPMLRLTPTMPCPPSAAHSSSIRLMAWCRAWYMAWVSGPNEP